ncbi:MAG: hypothetical protein N2Z71_04925 [Caloramator sp.]|nr:hypothetical protein [Caloramator sp.]
MPNINMPIYLNKNMIIDLYSTLINGYIETKEDTILNSIDEFSKLGLDYKKALSNDCKITDSKDKNITLDNSSSNVFDANNSIENRCGVRIQTRIRKTYATFTIFNSLKNLLINNNQVSFNTNIDYLKSSDFLELTGKISSKNLIPEIETILSILECYGTSNLNKLLPDTPKYSLTNFDFIYKQLKNLHDQLIRNNTTNLIFDCHNFNCILNINSSFFLDKTFYIYDYVDCECKFFCRINKKINNGEKFCLLYKTCMENYYTSFLNLTIEYLLILKDKGIIVPTEFDYTLSPPAIYATPLAIYK